MDLSNLSVVLFSVFVSVAHERRAALLQRGNVLFESVVCLDGFLASTKVTVLILAFVRTT